jgi:hypothetical protein
MIYIIIIKIILKANLLFNPLLHTIINNGININILNRSSYLCSDIVNLCINCTLYLNTIGITLVLYV